MSGHQKTAGLAFGGPRYLRWGKFRPMKIVLKAKKTAVGPHTPFAPAAIEDVIQTILTKRPDVVFAPHVETSSGMILPDEYVSAIGEAVQQVGGLFVLDCIASGTIWVDMQECNVDVLISAPQKGWSGSPCAGLVMLSERGLKRLEKTTSSSFACDLKKWHQIMKAYESGGHAYHATMPTDGLARFRDAIRDTEEFGLMQSKSAQQHLGNQIRAMLEDKGFKSVAAEGFKAPGVVVSYTDDPEIHSGKKFKDHGIQIAKGVPLRCDEPDGFQTFRLGLFGLDKLKDVDGAVARFKGVLDKII